MIKVSFEKNQVGKLQKVIVEGHASYNYEAGEMDIVCAGVSALTITFLNGLEEILKIDEKQLCRQVDSGFTSFCIPDFDDATMTSQIKLLSDVYALGIQSLADAYSDYITVIENRGGELNG